jgi:predicted ABC-class ATPase
MDRNGFSDPYVIAELYPQEGALVPTAKSKVISKTLNPEFNEVLKLETSHRPSNGVLRLLVVDYDRLSAAGKGFCHKCRVFVPPSHVVNGQTIWEKHTSTWNPCARRIRWGKRMNSHLR